MRAFDGDSGDTGAPFNGAGGGGSQRAIPIPDGVANTPAGARLAAMVESVSVEQVSGFDTVEYLKAAHRLVNHYQGVFLKALLETGVRLPAPDGQIARGGSPGEFACEEARAALVWSRSRAEGTLGRAYQMFGQTPAVGDALITGAVDEPRANAFLNWTGGLSDEHTTGVIDELLPIAPDVTVSELIDRIKKLAIALDPEWAERRYRDSLNDRRIELRQTPSGTADLAGRDLPVDRAKAGADRIHALAASCKQAGDSRRIDLIRADIYLGMIDGLFQHMTDQQVVQHVLTHPISSEPANGQDNDEGGGSSGGSTPDNGPSDDGRGSGAPGQDGDGGPSGNTPDDEHPSSGHDGPGPHGYDSGGGGKAVRPSGNQNTGGTASHGGRISNGGVGHSGMGSEQPAPSFARSAWNVRELRAELTTVLGMDDHPAELPGVGYVPASVARQHAAFVASGEWRFVICTEEGAPICSGITTRRPATAIGVRRDPQRGGIFELHLTASTLTELAADAERGQHVAWAPVIADIHDRYQDGIVDNPSTAESGTRTEAADARRRRARAGLRRWIEVRDRYCLHPVCRMPATRTDQDHRVDYAAGGPTTETNLDSECRHDHRLQHDGGWIVYRPPGSNPLTGPIVWISPLGHRYETRPPPVMTRYPEPGNHYPGHDSMPAWFTDLIEQVKAQRASANETGSDSAESEDHIRRPAKPTPEAPPF